MCVFYRVQFRREICIFYNFNIVHVYLFVCSRIHVQALSHACMDPKVEEQGVRTPPSGKSQVAIDFLTLNKLLKKRRDKLNKKREIQFTLY